MTSVQEALDKEFPVVVHESFDPLTLEQARDAVAYLRERARRVSVTRTGEGEYHVQAVWVNPHYTDHANRWNRKPKGPELANDWYNRRDLGASYRFAKDADEVPEDDVSALQETATDYDGATASTSLCLRARIARGVETDQQVIIVYIPTMKLQAEAVVAEAWEDPDEDDVRDAVKTALRDLGLTTAAIRDQATPIRDALLEDHEEGDP